MARSALTPFVAFLLVPVAGALPPGILDDARSGGDAGNTQQTALALGYGSYFGNMTPGDSDWYVFTTGSTLGCMDVGATASHAMRVAFGAGGSATIVTGLADGVFSTAMAVGAVSPRFAALPDEAPWDQVSVGPYAFSVDVAAAPSGEPTDAPSTPSGALQVTSECFRGRFRGDESDVDYYRFTAAAGDLLTYSLAQADGAGATLTIFAPSGAVAAPSVSAGDVGQVLLTASGVYHARAVSAPDVDGSWYTVGLAVGPEPTSCRPYCADVVE